MGAGGCQLVKFASPERRNPSRQGRPRMLLLRASGSAPQSEPSGEARYKRCFLAHGLSRPPSKTTASAANRGGRSSRAKFPPEFYALSVNNSRVVPPGIFLLMCLLITGRPLGNDFPLERPLRDRVGEGG